MARKSRVARTGWPPRHSRRDKWQDVISETTSPQILKRALPAEKTAAGRPAQGAVNENHGDMDSLQGEQVMQVDEERRRAPTDAPTERVGRGLARAESTPPWAVAAWNTGRQMRIITGGRTKSVPAEFMALQDWPAGGPADVVVWHVFSWERSHEVARQGLPSPSTEVLGVSSSGSRGGCGRVEGRLDRLVVVLAGRETGKA